MSIVFAMSFKDEEIYLKEKNDLSNLARLNNSRRIVLFELIHDLYKKDRLFSPIDTAFRIKEHYLFFVKDETLLALDEFKLLGHFSQIILDHGIEEAYNKSMVLKSNIKKRIDSLIFKIEFFNNNKTIVFTSNNDAACLFDEFLFLKKSEKISDKSYFKYFKNDIIYGEQKKGSFKNLENRIEDVKKRER